MLQSNFPIKYIKPLMKKMGFSLFRRCFYSIKNDVAYCVEFESPSSSIYVWFYIIPLYMPYEHRTFSFGNRCSSVAKFNLPPLSRDSSEQEAILWCEDLRACLINYIFPFFQSISTPQKILDFLKIPTKKRRLYFFCAKLFKLRLKTFSALYLGEKKQAQTALSKYVKALKKCSFLHLDILNDFFQEAISIKELFSCQPAALKFYFQNNIEITKKNCFGETGDET